MDSQLNGYINRLQTLATALSASIADLLLPYEHKYFTDPSSTFAGLQTSAYGRPCLATELLFCASRFTRVLSLKAYSLLLIYF